MSNLAEFGSSKIKSVNSDMLVFDEDFWFSREDKKRIGSSEKEWAMVGTDVYKGIGKAIKQLPNGLYTIETDSYDRKPVFIKKNVVHDKLIHLSGIPEVVVSEISDFWTKEKKFKDLGFLHRRGYLFYGSQGTGKTSLIFQIISSITDSVVFFCKNPDVFNEGLSVFRTVEPTRKVICVFEDIDEIIRLYGEKTLLSVLDGDNQINGVINLATTNYPELIDKRIVGRPRRFDRVYKIAALDDSARLNFLKNKLPKSENVKVWVNKTKGLSIASISEVIISVLCFNKPIDEAVEIVKDLSSNKSSEETSSLGFSEND